LVLSLSKTISAAGLGVGNAPPRTEVIMAIYRIDSAQLEPPPETDPTPADWMDGCPHAAACRMQWERLEGPVNDEGLYWMDDLARLLGCGEDCECAE
jgi:hypothetical protein